MARFSHSIGYEIRPAAPYSFELTAKKPAGWSLFTPFEVYEKGTLWTATHLHGTIAGIRLRSLGTAERPRIEARVFLKSRPQAALIKSMKMELGHDIGADEDMAPFYRFARKDRILKHTLGDLYGMHNT